MQIPDTEREALIAVMRQTEIDFDTAHETICKLQGLPNDSFDWPEYSSQANTLRWFKAIRKKFGIKT